MPAKPRSKPAAKKPVRSRVRAAKPRGPNVPTTNKERVRRLRRWAQIVVAVPKKQWDMDVWMERRGVGPQCGTVGCALGHAGMDAGFRALGLKTTAAKHRGSVCLRGDGDGSMAAATFFGITSEEAKQVTWPWTYEDEFNIRRAEVAARIIELADQYEEAGVEPARQQAPVGEVAHAV